MTVLQLIQKLQTLPQNAIVLSDKSGNDYSLPADVLGEVVVVAQGIGYQVSSENYGTDYWISQNSWEYCHAGAPLEGKSAVYIGSGQSIVGPLWTKK